MTIYVISVATGETLETHETDTYDLGAKTVTLPAGRGTTTIQYGDDVVLRLNEGVDPVEAMARMEAIL